MTIRAVILSSARTGSTWLGESLSQHKSVTYDKELLLDLTKSPEADQTTDAARQIIERHASACRTPLHLWKLQQWQSRMFPGLLESLKFDRVIFLRRENLFEWYVSNQVAKHRRVYTKRLGDVLPDVAPFPVDPKDMERAMTAELEWWGLVRYLHQHRRDFTQVTYDELVKNYDECIESLLTFLSVNPIPVFSPMLKMQERNPRSQVTNFYEVQDYFRGSAFYKYGFQ